LIQIVFKRWTFDPFLTFGTFGLGERKLKMTAAETYEKAIDARVTFSDGTQRSLSELWENGPLFLVFLRHFG
jgi:hypothetical protein